MSGKINALNSTNYREDFQTKNLITKGLSYLYRLSVIGLKVYQ